MSLPPRRDWIGGPVAFGQATRLPVIPWFWGGGGGLRALPVPPLVTSSAKPPLVSPRRQGEVKAREGGGAPLRRWRRRRRNPSAPLALANERTEFDKTLAARGVAGLEELFSEGSSLCV